MSEVEVIDESGFVAGLAVAVHRLAQQEVPGKLVYDDVVQRVYNHFVLRTLPHDGYATPDSVPAMIDLIADVPVRTWLPGSDSEAVLVHKDTRSPTQECAELIVGNRHDPIGEKLENEILGEVLDTCRALDAPESYEAFRRLLIENPTLTYAEHVTERARMELMPVVDLLDRCYETASARLRRDDHYAQCAWCGCLLRPIGQDDWRCDLDRCRARTTKVSRLIDANTPGGVLHLRLPLRTFVTGPGLFELDLETKLHKCGLDVEMWPKFDTYDLLITFPDGARWAVDVKDYANPRVLGRKFAGIPSDPPRDQAFLVVPDYRRTGDKQYLEKFRTARESAGRPPLALRFVKKFMRDVDRRLSLQTKEGSDA
jgi:hypothetical protein